MITVDPIFKGLTLLAPMPNKPTLKVAAPPIKEWARRKPLDATDECKIMRMNI
jgi:hypothetical protein